MPDVDIDVNNTLWGLILATVMFLAVFVLVSSLLPGDFGYPYKDYEKYYPGAEKLSGSDLDIFSSYDNFTATFGTTEAGNYYDKAYMSLDLRLHFVQSFGFYPTYFWMEHIEARFPIGNFPIWAHGLLFKGHSPVVLQDIIDTYENRTRSSKITMECGHGSFTFTFLANDTSEDVLLAWQNGHAISVRVDYQVNFTNMGTNIWTILSNIFTFQTIKTGVLVIDLLLNSLISVPTFIASGYILYRLITGLIPTLSGGGGA